MANALGYSGSPGATETPLPASTSGDAALAQRLYTEAVAAQKAGDWATYGAKLQQLGSVLDRLASHSASATAGGKK